MYDVYTGLLQAPGMAPRLWAQRAPPCCGEGPPGNSRWVSSSAAVKKRIGIQGCHHHWLSVRPGSCHSPSLLPGYPSLGQVSKPANVHTQPLVPGPSVAVWLAGVRTTSSLPRPERDLTSFSVSVYYGLSGFGPRGCNSCDRLTDPHYFRSA